MRRISPYQRNAEKNVVKGLAVAANGYYIVDLSSIQP
jgi:hypothetical protein